MRFVKLEMFVLGNVCSEFTATLGPWKYIVMDPNIHCKDSMLCGTSCGEAHGAALC